MDNVKGIISSKEVSGIADYFNLYRRIKQEVEDKKPQGEKNIKIAILSSFTINGIKETLFVKCWELGISPIFHVGEYNQYAQEILNKNSGLYKSDPDLIIIFIDIRTIMGEYYLLPYQISDEQRKDLLGEKLKEIQSLIQKIEENSSAKILIHNFELPSYSPLGIVESKQKFGFIESIETLNADLRNAFKNDSQVFIFDYNSFCSRIGKQNIIDYKMYYIADMKLNLQYVSELCNEYLSYIKPMLSLSKKCIVLDLDNVLWGGIVGEDGLEGIKLGPTPEGRPFLEFQRYLLSLFNRGVILAINSKNNLDDAVKVFREHPYELLKEEHFAAMQINWNDKISNMKAVAEEINIGLDSFVYFDDDKLNREMIENALPEVKVVDLPEDASIYLKTLMELNDFNSFYVSEEDKKRGQMYAGQRKRQKLSKRTIDITEYLAALDMVVTIEKANSFNIPRIAQLTQKTNQFNMTTKRYLEEDIKRFSENKDYLVSSIKVEDKFGDNGIVGAAIVKKGEERWIIDSFLLSCRVIGRRVEETMLAYILEEAKEEKEKTLIGEFIPTKKNIPAKGFYKRNGFKLVEEKDGVGKWEFLMANEYKYPEFIKVDKK
ncbi:MAG: HAD-IIIC family phosphatase [Candidatus Omnitrophica bacterium]|nr:HAD-IIIC family phosphatase [Candidatus Omnitrophota bacterium]